VTRPMKLGTGPMREVRYTIILPNGPQPRQTTQMSAYPSLDELKAITSPLGIGYLEYYEVWHEGVICDFVCDDEAKIKRWPVNEWATSVWSNNVDNRKLTVKLHGERICGPAVVFHDKVFIDDPNQE